MENLAPNSQWEIFSGMTYGTRWNVQGTGTLGQIHLTGYSIVRGQVVLAVSGSTTAWKTGDLIAISGPGLPTALSVGPLRIRALVADTSITVIPPLGLMPTGRATGIVTPINIGGLASSGTGDAADGWKKSISTSVWREDNAANVATGAIFALGVNKRTPADEAVYLNLDIRLFRGKRICFGAEVNHKVRTGAGDWEAFIDVDGVTVATSSQRAAPNSFDWREASAAISGTAATVQVGLRFHGANGDTYYVCNPTLVVGSSIGPGNYTKPRELLFPIVHISPVTWINASITFPTALSYISQYAIMFDAYAETGGQIATTVLRADGSIEGNNSNPANSTTDPENRLIGWANATANPVLLGPFMGHYGANVKSYGAVNIPFDGTGRAVCFSGKSGDNWFNLSMDFDLFYLKGMVP